MIKVLDDCTIEYEDERCHLSEPDGFWDDEGYYQSWNRFIFFGNSCVVKIDSSCFEGIGEQTLDEVMCMLVLKEYKLDHLIPKLLDHGFVYYAGCLRPYVVQELIDGTEPDYKEAERFKDYLNTLIQEHELPLSFNDVGGRNLVKKPNGNKVIVDLGMCCFWVDDYLKAREEAKADDIPSEAA